MASEQIEMLLNEIGQILAEDREYAASETLLYAQVGDKWCSPAIFKSLGNQFLYREADMKAICKGVYPLRIGS